MSSPTTAPRPSVMQLAIKEKAALHDRCRDGRGDMTPHETADCAGERVSEEYENEEDGGT